MFVSEQTAEGDSVQSNTDYTFQGHEEEQQSLKTSGYSGVWIM